jgi:hypothetical protein
VSQRFATGKHAIAICDRCGFQYKLQQLRREVVNQQPVEIRVCPTCWEPDQPQLQLGRYIVQDPQAVRNPRPDTSYGESRDIQWGFAPVGLNNPLALSGLQDALQASTGVGTVTVTTE